MPSLVPTVPIHLDRERHLRLDNRALFDAELMLARVWGRKVSILQLLMDPQTLGMNDIAVLLLAGLKHEDRTLTLEQVQAAIPMAQFATLLEALYRAWNLATAPADGSPAGEEDALPFATASPGNAIGALPASSLD